MLYKEEKIKSDEFLNLKKKGEELLYEAPNKKAVTALQSFLNEEGYTDQNGEKLWEDGRYDANTANAVLRYQNENGLKGDGITGDKTWNHIYNKKRKKEEEASFTEEQKERSNQNLNVIRQEQINLDIEPEGFLDGEDEEATSSGASYDVQEGNEESSADISGAEEESFNDRVNRNWENGEEDTLPEIKDYDATQDEGDDVDYSSIFAYESPIGTLTLASELSPDMLPAPIPAYNPNGIAFNDYVVSDESVPRASGGNYERVFPSRIPVSKNNTFAIGKPEATLTSNTGSKESGRIQQSEYAYFDEFGENTKRRLEDLTEYVGEKVKNVVKWINKNLDTEILFGFKGREFLEFLYKTDIRGVVNTDYRKKYNFEEFSAKMTLKKELNLLLNSAVEKGKKVEENTIIGMLDNIESFDDASITTAYYLNDFDGATYLGHAGILLVNEDGESVLFSFYPQNQNELKNSASEMRISVFNKGETDYFIKNKKSIGIATSGVYVSEQYENMNRYVISSEQGKAMFEQAVAITAMDNFKYNLLEQNCEHVALSILKQGDVDISKLYAPNLSYGWEIIRRLVNDIIIINPNIITYFL